MKNASLTLGTEYEVRSNANHQRTLSLPGSDPVDSALLVLLRCAIFRTLDREQIHGFHVHRIGNETSSSALLVLLEAAHDRLRRHLNEYP